ncbi:hypothetical protein FA95DRAFT_1580759 [Auriscalpium vulgare]|uniref:Uncharacterized protein n=1 Tax=Auriscalpium vulgare TaxID=40419 RepID=A0ACB8S4V3_9AGAM|nr:hypothetical protein FA95DRAFT_1580759 [Auriscalpium vulgare]
MSSGNWMFDLRLLSTKSLPPFSPSSAYKPTQAPNPAWQLGEGLSTRTPLEKKWRDEGDLGWKTWDMGLTSNSDAYKLLGSAITPRPIALVSSVSASGIPNLAPFRYELHSKVAYNPPLISLSFTLSPRRPKDTRENILATKEFVVNLISEPFVAAANSTSVESPQDTDEWKVSGLTGETSVHVKPRRVRESAVSLECELYNFQDIYPDGSETPSTSLVLGRVRYVHVRNSVLQDDGLQVDAAKLRIVSRLGGATYARLGESFDLKSDKPRENIVGDRM